MTARRLVFVVTAAVFWPLAPAAGAIPNTCPTNGPDAGTVNIVEPAPGATFAGQVTVRGRASAPAGLTRVELFVGEALKDFQVFDPGLTDLEFFLRFDVASVQSTTPTLSVVACGGGPGNAVRGIASIGVRVDRAAVVTAPPLAITPVELTDDRPGTESRTGPAWVGAAFGLAGLGGLLAATRLKGARAATAPSPGAGTAASPVRRRPRLRARPEAPGAGTAPPRPSPPRRTPAPPPPAGRPVRPRGGRADGRPGATVRAGEAATRRVAGPGRAAPEAGAARPAGQAAEAGGPARPAGQAAGAAAERPARLARLARPAGPAERPRQRGRGRGQWRGERPPGSAPPPAPPSGSGGGDGRPARRG